MRNKQVHYYYYYLVGIFSLFVIFNCDETLMIPCIF